MHTAGGIVVSLIQGFFGCVFLYFAHALGRPLLEYRHLRSIIGNNYNLPVVQLLSAVVVTLIMNGVFLILNVVITLLYVIIIQSSETPVAINQVYLWLIPVLRLCLFYWQVCPFLEFDALACLLFALCLYYARRCLLCFSD